MTPCSRSAADELARAPRTSAGVHAGGGLVEQQQLRLGRERAGDLEPALLASARSRGERRRAVPSSPTRSSRLVARADGLALPRAAPARHARARREKPPRRPAVAARPSRSRARSSSRNSRTFWKVRATPQRGDAVRRQPVDRPRRRTRIVPAVGGSTPVSRLNSVVLPAPFGPITAWIGAGLHVEVHVGDGRIAAEAAWSAPRRCSTAAPSRAGRRHRRAAAEQAPGPTIMMATSREPKHGHAPVLHRTAAPPAGA